MTNTSGPSGYQNGIMLLFQRRKSDVFVANAADTLIGRARDYA